MSEADQSIRKTPKFQWIMGLLIISTAALFALAVHDIFFRDDSSKQLALFAIVLAVVLVIVAVLVDRGISRFQLSHGETKLQFEFQEQHYLERLDTLQQELPQKILDDEKVAIRQEEVANFLVKNNRRLPDSDAPSYDLIADRTAQAIMVRPSAYPTTPMYLLDSFFRVIDWNEAFSVAFDSTLEGRLGESILEWTYHLDNFEQVLDHGTKTFSDKDNLPWIDVEDVQFTSDRYGQFTAVKRAYQIPGDGGENLAWLVTFELKFDDTELHMKFHRDLAQVLSLEQLWSEYALSYDAVLNNSKVYPELLDTMIGDLGPLSPIPSDAKILDLGAGTGNLALKLMAGANRRLVVALEKNRTMLNRLQARCGAFIRDDDLEPGIIARRQDALNLHGLDTDYFDTVVLNNVLYSIENADDCLKAVRRILKPGGDVRISGPKQDSNPDKLFAQIRKELEEAGKFEQLRDDFLHVYEINRFRLRRMLHRWETSDVARLLENAGFSVTESSEEVYAGQSMLVSAIKPS
jgi:ubiquinone/menaquinone biosynthesis C-methylase UbiE